MGLLDRYFSSAENSRERLAGAIVAGAVRHEEVLREYVQSVLQKRDVILSLTVANYQQQLPILKTLLTTELVELGEEQQTDERLVANIAAFDHQREIKRAKRLDDALGYAEMKYEHVHYFLVQLYHVLRSQIAVVLLLEKGGDTAELLDKLNGLWNVEKGLLDQMSKRDGGGNKLFVDASSFKDSVVGIFSALLRGEQIIAAMDRSMRLLVRQLEPRMRQSDEHRGDLVDFIDVIFAAIDDRIHELAASGDDQHENIHLDVVNRPDFLNAVVRPKNAEHGNLLSEDELQAFVLIFRNWYNKMNL